MESPTEPWFEDEPEDDEYQLTEYEITASPNDFNILTLNSFIQSGAVKVPGFQRNYVWDIKRASRLIESLIIGLPIPQIFLYQEAKNKFLVIDGQQRLMSIYYFLKKRFPKEGRRSELRRVFDEHGRIPEAVLEDDEYFTRFNLSLSGAVSGRKHPLRGVNYATLDEDLRSSFELRTIRNVIIKQNTPSDDDSSVFEIFNRLNSGGVNLTSQEIRASLYHSPFYDLLSRLNLDERWRNLIGLKTPDLHMKDIEILLRGFAMAFEGDNYKPSMKRFLNEFSKKAKTMLPDSLERAEKMFLGFLGSAQALPERSFGSKKTGRFNISVFDAVFAACCAPIREGGGAETVSIDGAKLQALKNDVQFEDAALLKSTTDSVNVKTRLERARVILS